MKDQASTLRFMASSTSADTSGSANMNSENQADSGNESARRAPRYIAVTGGKGGVGKSNLSVNLALELGALGNKVTLLDADFGLANADLLCGVSPKFHLGHVIKGAKDLDDVITEIGENVNLIPGGSGFEDLANMSLAANSYVFAKLRELEQGMDFMLLDTAAGIAENVAGTVIQAEEVIVVVTPEPTSIVDAYATIKLILRNDQQKPISVVVNSTVGVRDDEKVFLQMYSAVRGFLDHEIKLLGNIPLDPQVSKAVRDQVPIVRYDPGSPASRAIRMIAKHIHTMPPGEHNLTDRSESFWEALAQK